MKSPLTNKEYLLERFSWWGTRLGLSNAWDITYVLEDTVDSPEENAVAVCCTYAHWEYLEATITCNMEEINKSSHQEIEQYVLHELLHVLIAEVDEETGRQKHIERAVTLLTRAFLRKEGGNE